jgi:hypothetical protein
MRVLHHSLKRGGFRLSLVKRAGKVAIYRQHVNGAGTDRFEVVKITTSPARVINGKAIEAGERYPTDDQWGTYGFTAWDMAEAETIYGKMQAGL